MVFSPQQVRGLAGETVVRDEATFATEDLANLLLDSDSKCMRQTCLKSQMTVYNTYT